MSRTAYWLNTAWMLSCAREAHAFHNALGKVRVTQRQILMRILRDNQATWYGRQFGFGEIRSVTEYQQHVPIVGYEQLRDAIGRIATGEGDVLTHDPVRLLEPTGGSSQAEKLIPYNASLKREFQRAISAWVHDVMSRLPAARNGRSYWSISPLSEAARVSSGGIPIGFADDTDYLSSWQRHAVSRLMIMPSEVRRLRSIDDARYATLLYLLASADLSLVSVWSPTYLTSLLAELPRCWRAICDDVRSGQVRFPGMDRKSSRAWRTFPADPRRADQLQAIFGGSTDAAEVASRCWPRLSLVSCWGDATSALYLPQIQTQFPHAVVQPKGLLATEGVVSIPMVSVHGSVLAIRSHFLEFVDASQDGEVSDRAVFLADELELGRQYRVILTTGGGLYRYDLADEIEVVGFLGHCPCIRLIGRGQDVSDLVGEKLRESFVRSVLESLSEDLPFRFSMVAPILDPLPGYRLYIELAAAHESGIQSELANRVETLLGANPNYRAAVAAGQLRPIDVKLIKDDGWTTYVDTCTARGQKSGDVKPVALHTWSDWDSVFVRR